MDLRKATFDRAKETECRLLDLYFSSNEVPVDLKEVSGAIVSLLPDDPLVIKLKENGIPVVRCGQFKHPLDHTQHSIIPDWELIGRMSATHFIERGYRNYAIVGNSPVANFKTLYDSFIEKVEGEGFNCQLFQFNTHVSMDDKVYRQMTKEFISWVKTVPKPLAIFTGHDIMACRLLLMCSAHGISVPEEVAFLCPNADDITCETTPIHVSSVRLGKKAQGRKAIDLLLKILDGKVKEITNLYCPPEKIIERKSSNYFSGASPVVEEAIRYIWENFRQPISVESIAKHVRVSRRKLEYDLKGFLHRTVGEELRRKRLEEAQYLLRTTDENIDEVAHMCGIGESVSLQRAFKKYYSITPSQYRQSQND